MSWINICVEGFCFGGKNDGSNYPCGLSCPSHLCLEKGHCPHFAYSETTERRVASFPPLRLILKDKLGIWGDELWWKLRWWFWDCLWFNRRKTRQFFESIPVVSKDNYPDIYIEEQTKERNARRRFKRWFKKVKDEREEG